MTDDRERDATTPSLQLPQSATLPYQPFGGAAVLMTARDPEVLLSGPAGTGKSLACLTKLYLAAMKYPGMRGLIARKTRESVSESALVTWEQKVIPPGHPLTAGAKRRARQVYTFPNGSEVAVGGLDSAQKVMSTEFDMVYVQEAIELTEDDWEALTTRLRNARMPYQQLLADTNPSHPRHWLKRRCDDGRTRLIESRHEDNPSIVNPRTGRATPQGEAYLAKLDSLTGARKPRLRHGRWAQAEGVVYDGWDATVHLVNARPIPHHWTRYWAIDFGFTNPFVWQFWAEDEDGILHLYREIYRTGRLVEDLAREGLAMCDGEPGPRAVVCDHDAEDRATLERHTGVLTEAADKGVRAGIQEVAGRLAIRGNGRPRLYVNRDARGHPADPVLVAAARPTCTADEFDGYVWDPGRASREAPLKKDDHGMDALRYLCRKLSDDSIGRSAGYAGDPDADPFADLPPRVFR